MRIALLSDEYLPWNTRFHTKAMRDLAVALKDYGHQPVVINADALFQKFRKVIGHIHGEEKKDSL